MGVCDLKYLQVADIGNGMPLDIDIRTKALRDYSFIESAVVKLGNETLEVASYGASFFNGVADANLPVTISGFPLKYTQKSKNQHVFRIEITSSEHIVLSTNKQIVNVMVENADGNRFSESRGLMG